MLKSIENIEKYLYIYRALTLFIVNIDLRRSNKKHIKTNGFDISNFNEWSVNQL